MGHMSEKIDLKIKKGKGQQKKGLRCPRCWNYPARSLKMTMINMFKTLLKRGTTCVKI